MERSLARRAAMVGGLLATTVAFGTLGFVIVEGYPVFDAFYMKMT